MSVSANKNLQQDIVADLAKRIEERAKERLATKSATARSEIMSVMLRYWPHSSDETLQGLAMKILKKGKITSTDIMTEIRELNSDLVPSEREVIASPFGEEDELQ